MNFSDGGLVSTLSASHRRVSAQQLKFGYTDSDTVFVLSRDWRTKHHHLDLYHLPTNCKLKGNLSCLIIREKTLIFIFFLDIDLTTSLGGDVAIDRCFSVLGGILVSVTEGSFYNDICQYLAI